MGQAGSAPCNSIAQLRMVRGCAWELGICLHGEYIRFTCIMKYCAPLLCARKMRISLRKNGDVRCDLSDIQSTSRQPFRYIPIAAHGIRSCGPFAFAPPICPNGVTCAPRAALRGLRAIAPRATHRRAHPASPPRPMPSHVPYTHTIRPPIPPADYPPLSPQVLLPRALPPPFSGLRTGPVFNVWLIQPFN